MRYFISNCIKQPLDVILQNDTLQALGELLSQDGARVVVGKNCSPQASQLEKLLCKGLMKKDCAIWLCGVAPLPAINYVAKTQGADWMVMICSNDTHCSVCLYGKNGKILLPKEVAQIDGALCAILNVEKGDNDPHQKSLAYCPKSNLYPAPLSNVSADCLTEDELESELVINQLKKNHRIRIVEGVLFLYSKHVVESFLPFPNQKVRLWISSSTMSSVAPKVFRDLGCDVTIEATKQCLEECAKTVKKDEIGFVFNQDGTKLVTLIDKKAYDGDGILLALSTLYRLQGKLKKKLVVGSTLSSTRLQRELAYHNTALYRAKDGECEMYKSLLETACLLGAERDGRVLMLDKSQCADALLCALSLLEVKRTIGNLPKFVPYQTCELVFDAPVSQTAEFERDLESLKTIYNKKGRLLFLTDDKHNTSLVYFECFVQNYADAILELEKDLHCIFEKHSLQNQLKKVNKNANGFE